MLSSACFEYLSKQGDIKGQLCSGKNTAVSVTVFIVSVFPFGI